MARTVGDYIYPFDNDTIYKVTRPSSNWLALQKSFVQHGHRPRKRRKIDCGESTASPLNGTSAFSRNTSSPPPKRHDPDNPNEHIDLETTEEKNGESIAGLRKMVLGKVEYKVSHTNPGKYLALDCEMVGIGIEGNESSLARVSIVNYTGAIILDVFVQQRERVVDYRTKWSGVRSADLAGSAKPFKEVQQTVGDLIKDRVLVGHAVYNDLKALLLSHPSPQLRDTQSLAYKYRVVKSRRPALRVLVKQELGIVIQGGEHSSVIDARATMALFRLYKKQWESGFRPLRTLGQSPPFSFLPQGRKRKHSESTKAGDDSANQVSETSSSSSPRARSPSPSSTPSTRSLTQHRKQRSQSRPPAGSGQGKGISSGASTVISRTGGIKEVRRNGAQIGDGGKKGRTVRNSSKGGKIGKVGGEWWKSLGGGKKSRIKQ